MERADPYYKADLAWVHHAGFGFHVARTAAGIVRLLPQRGTVLDVGCGSGLLARALLAAGFEVIGVDASPAMIELARETTKGAHFEVVSLPAKLPQADSVVSTGHVLNYVGDREAIASTIVEMARALRPSGVIAFDLLTPRYAKVREKAEPHARIEDDWAIITRFSQPAPHRFDRAISVFRRDGEVWRRSDELHKNVTFEADEAVRLLAGEGVQADVRASFGDEELPEGLAVVVGRR